MAAQDRDQQVRLAAFTFLDEQRKRLGDVLPRGLLLAGFTFEGSRVPLISPQQGIFKPALLPDMPLTITTAPVVEGRDRPYDDDIGPDNLLRYRYRGQDPQHRDNVGLRLAMRRQAPLIYMFGVVPGRYMPTYPVYIVGDDPAALTFTVAVDDRIVATAEGTLRESVEDARRRYITAATRKRLHQEGFRTRVLLAYREHCAICRLRHVELLEAAHILPDTHPLGLPIVPNGLALCKLHHAAFDAHVIGIRPDYVIEIRRDVLEEEDGPMLQHGLQGFHGGALHVPRPAALRPDRDFLSERFEAFRAAQ